MSFILRLITYVVSWVAYLSFTASHAPLGNGWLPWHFQRIYNAVEYLKQNGYLSSYGFTIWDKCQNCSLEAAEWVDKIYLSAHSIPLSPYIVLNHFWGREALQFYGPIIDKLVIFIAAVATAELIIKCVKSYSKITAYFVGVSCFLLFSTAPWTYKMLIASWSEIYFLMFFLLGLLSFSKQRNLLACILFVMSGLFHWQWAFAVSIFYVLIIFISFLTIEPSSLKRYFPPSIVENSKRLFMIVSLLIGAVVMAILRFIAMQNFKGIGSSFFTRIGIAGDDIYNGGLLGALQFLGGNRITVCFADYSTGNISFNLVDGIAAYNCSLSIAGMTALSLLAIVGIFILLKRSELSKWMVLPILFTLLMFVTIFQQSLSVHLMGYSYIFSFMFATGIMSLILYFSQYVRSSVLSIVFFIPCLVGIVFLSVRVSMLTGVNG